MACFGVADRAVQLLAERKIEAAIAGGKFDRLPGRGRPLPGMDRPYDPTQWVRDWLLRNGVRLDPRQVRR